MTRTDDTIEAPAARPAGPGPDAATGINPPARWGRRWLQAAGVTNDLVWWIPFSMLLWDAARSAGALPTGPATSLDDALDGLVDRNGRTLRSLSDEHPTLLVLTRLRGHGIGRLAGDGFQMPGAFVIEKGRVVRAFRSRLASNRPDYGVLVCEAAP